MPQAPDAKLTRPPQRLSARSSAIPRQAGRARGVPALARGWRHTLAILLVGLATATQAQTPGVPQQGLPRTELTAGMHRIVAEVAADHASRATGLMHRRSLAPNHGMLFVFQEKTPQCFWMRNTLIALSIAFLDDDGRVVNIEDMAPLTENSHCAKEPVRFALEMEQGWFAKRGVRAGDRLGGREVFRSP